MNPGIAGLFLHGMAGIGKSMLATQIADRISTEHPETEVITVTGTLSVDKLVASLVADSPSLVVLDQFDTNVRAGAMANHALDAVMMCLIEEIAGRDDPRRQARVIFTARQPLVLSPHILFRHVGPLSRQSADELTLSLPRLGKLTNAEREYAWRLTAGHPGSLQALDARLADTSFAKLADSLAAAIATRTRMTAAALILPTELDPGTAATIASAIEAVLSQPAARSSALVPRASAAVSLDGLDEGRRQPRRNRLLVVSAILTAALIAWAPFAVKSLVTGSAPAAVTVQAAHSGIHDNAHSVTHVKPAVKPAVGAATGPAPAAEAATWLAGNVTSGTLIGCDPAMCASLSHQGVPAADLSPLRPGSNLTTDDLIVATPQARTLMGSAITAAAPELAASFGTGSGRVGIWEVTPGGAAAYTGLLAADLASRSEGGNLILGNTSIKSSGNNWMVLCSGHVDTRILLALGEIAHSMPLTIVSFGAANPGAAPDVPVRSIVIDVADPTAAAAYLRVQNPVMQPLTVRMGRSSLWVEYGAPSPLGLFQAEP
jgi:ATPase family associated with various cellular activities (AAA)